MKLFILIKRSFKELTFCFSTITITAIITLISVCISSCIKDEAPNAEADIIACYLPDDILSYSTINVGLEFNKNINAYPIYISVKPGTDITSLAPEFELTPGATINPPSGSTQDFTKPVRYIVTSEDGKWHRTYSIDISILSPANIPTFFSFEKADTEGKYHILFEESESGSITWGSGNSGFALAMSTAEPDEYPTVLSDEGLEGNCVKMVTRTTGYLGSLVGMPIASGNLFLGNFDVLNALSKPLEATKFGVPFDKKPKTLTGYYKYKSGSNFFENNAYTDKKDEFSIYAILYELPENGKLLDGNLQIKDFEDDSMIALALMEGTEEKNEWTKFEIPFDYNRYGKAIDNNKLESGKYYFSIVFASSKEGALFKGAEGSTLMIDNVELIYE